MGLPLSHLEAVERRRRSTAWGRWSALALLAASPAWTSTPAESHLLAGVDAFRAQQFDLALVELKVSQKLGARGEVLWYLAATLTKLHRVDEALDAFATARAEAPGAGDPLLDYYQAMACYDARLLVCAERLLANVEAGAGPRVASQASKVRADIAAVLAAEPPDAAIDACLASGWAALARGRSAVATLYFEEARALARRRADGRGSQEATDGLDASQRPAPPQGKRP